MVFICKREAELQGNIGTKAKTACKRITLSGLEEDFKDMRCSHHSKADIPNGHRSKQMKGDVNLYKT